ncbi:MAG: efflux RND transporter periplasmic adaptor subunit [Verrucomicrobiae bacterium]|nr:efflux RND transporter periplasmic adaptor subunit [Verrucomicrobiae bacterium]
MKVLAKILLPLLVLGGAGWLTWWLIASKPEPPQQKRPPAVTRVEATRIRPTHYDVILETRGVVQPRTETSLLPEVSGRIEEISSNFREGSFFEAGDLLVRIDRLNYETALTIAESNLAQARTALAEEEARADQALENWKRLGKTGEPGDLALRKPQVAEMQARLKAAEAEVVKAKRDLERTEILAPYAGRVLEQNVDIGQYVTPGTQLAKVYAIDFVEIRLPLNNRQLAFVDLPELYRGNVADSINQPGTPAPEVLLSADLGGQTMNWKGRIVRAEGAIDERTRQLFVVAQVDNPYQRRDDGAPPLKIGLFTDALIRGKTLENVFVIPRSAARAGEEVIVISPDNKIERRPVKPIWSDRDNVIVSAEKGGLEPGEVLCLTPLAYPANGAPVLPTIDGIAPSIEASGPRGKGGPEKAKEKPSESAAPKPPTTELPKAPVTSVTPKESTKEG